MDDDKLAKAKGRKIQAEGLLGSDMLNEAFAELERAYVQAWRETPHDNVTGREKLYLAVNVIGKVKEHLTKVVNDGKMAEAELARLAKDEERKRRFGI